MTWLPLAQRFSTLPLILAGPILRRTESRAVTVWLALKESQMVTLRIYTSDEAGHLMQRFEGTRRTIRLGDHLHVVAVTARARHDEEGLSWGGLSYYDLFFQAPHFPGSHVSVTGPHLETAGVLVMHPPMADPLQRLVYPGHPLPSFVLPAEDLNQVRILHGSCRKPHGVGKEMLSAVDTILEDCAHISAHRPQQLFLTGDQIYADDVAEPLLHLLIDAGEVLFAGNLQEVLPLVNLPAHLLAPGSRRDVVRNQALLTTQDPQNHLLSLQEYSSMYLFAWSDVLWPEDVPISIPYQHSPTSRPLTAHQQKEGQQYLSILKQVQEFRATLPQVRRALANISTYMICDDHDVTDDWYLDGAWCQRVLGNPLGRHILRNALLAYALFQGWGNAPEQFDAPNGKALLQAVDAWHADETDSSASAISELVGVPSAAFVGSGHLQRSERALRWHYTLPSPRYHVIVLDTRTERTYPSPHAFPGLLSPSALREQVTNAASKHAEITVLVSATPVLGVDLVEALQFWSRMHSKDNYSYDPEAWALERFTFQRFLKAISPMKRVVILSGDVHYAFGSSLDYWDYHTKETAKLVNYTSSPLRNEGAGPQIAALAMGYPHFFHRVKRHEIPTVDLFVWDLLAGDTQALEKVFKVLRLRAYQVWWSVPHVLDIWQSPQEIVFPAQGWPKGAFNAFPPDRSYRLSYLPHGSEQATTQKQSSSIGQVQLVEPRNPTMEGIQASHASSAAFHKQACALMRRAVEGVVLLERDLERRSRRLADVIHQRDEWVNQRKVGMHIVGSANLGEIGFAWTAREKDVLQRLWWWHPAHPERPTLATEYRQTLLLPAVDAAPPFP
jgi:hypothetical protein